MIRYYGIPGTNIVKFGNDEDHKPAEQLPRRDDLVQLDDHYAWGRLKIGDRETPAQVAGAAPLALALCAHALRNDQRAIALYQRFKMRVMEKWKATEPWAVTVEEIAAVCDRIEEDAAATEKERLAIERERPGIETDTGGQSFGHGGVVWHTDEAGREVKPKE